MSTQLLGLLFFVPRWCVIAQEDFGAILRDYRAKLPVLDPKRKTRLDLFERLHRRVSQASDLVAHMVRTWEQEGEVKRVEEGAKEVIEALNGYFEIEPDCDSFPIELLLFELREAIDEMLSRQVLTPQGRETIKRGILVMSQYYIMTMCIFEYAKDQQALLCNRD